MASSRRRLVGGFAALALGQAALLRPSIGVARKRKKKIKTNLFGCIDVGGKCYGKDAKCCSGVCDGSGKRSKCAARNEGLCTRNDNSCPEFVACGADGECFRTTGKSSFCGRAGTCDCHPCKKDKDCDVETGPGSACIICMSDCIDVNGSKKGTACVPPAVLA